MTPSRHIGPFSATSGLPRVRTGKKGSLQNVNLQSVKQSGGSDVPPDAAQMATTAENVANKIAIFMSDRISLFLTEILAALANAVTLMFGATMHCLYAGESEGE